MAFFKRITRLILQDSCYSLLHSLFFFFLFVCFFCYSVLLFFFFFSFIGLRLKISLQLLVCFFLLFCFVVFLFFFFHWFAVKNKFAIAFVSLVDWLGNLAPYSQPIRGKNKTNYDWFARVSRPERWPYVFYSRYDWLFRLPSSF